MSSAGEYVVNAGGSVISQNALRGLAPIRWAVREPQMNPVDNGWRFFSAADDSTYLADPANMTVVDFNTVVGIEPAVLPLLHMPVGTDVEIGRALDGRISLIDAATGRPLHF